ncbi:hypothetical protein IRJ41_003552 [Triplophysa rosa]|uniref:Uncharacterized protein n=1 Tax=Triplophysa rosa TaxID=992332 RepID=A0A9W7TJW8_TRIRA|nr:hypothetical protein IRJ41_003552 [Triplophysa rosa]
MNSAVSVQSAEDVDPFEGYEPITSWADYMDKAEAEGYIDPRPLKIPSWAVLDFPLLAEDLKTSPAVPATGQETRAIILTCGPLENRTALKKQLLHLSIILFTYENSPSIKQAAGPPQEMQGLEKA